ncbi:hypothetical protein KTH_14690 [Thermosporothrix hazakensis]|uniref:Uncharacterized protein n=1 Tax=Thermosporothrix sp. COM3 TaxID=2490863 RepID=A0A455SIZ7_9CHLR|nr:hypothetical protein KTC_31640 [Thermosporothrix sp. COM3]GCE46600.1 hypothetical protein KTH_14690 [Thermosporothrix hazakensis]
MRIQTRQAGITSTEEQESDAFGMDPEDKRKPYRVAITEEKKTQVAYCAS